jgi:hypothetical protein
MVTGRSISSKWRPLVTAALLGAGCSSDLVQPDSPSISTTSVDYSPFNVISAVVTGEVEGADSVAVEFGLTGGTLDNSTPASSVSEADPFFVPVFALLPNSTYQVRAVAWKGSRVVRGQAHSFSTGTLPGDLPRYTASGTDPSAGFVVLAADPYGVVIDNTGRVVWYHRFPNGSGLNFQAQPNGRYVARPPPSGPSEPAPFMEVDPFGRTTRTLDCLGGPRPRFHDLLVEPDGSYWILCDETRVMDLSQHGGHPSANVTGTVIQHVGVSGELLFEWSVFDHFAIGDLDPAERNRPTVNWTHGNALDLDKDGNLLVSFRNLSEITKIDTRSGQIIWRMGGAGNQFTFHETPPPPFARQHGVRVTEDGRVLLLDNLGDPNGSRARLYDVDGASRTARLVAQYASQPSVVGELGGTTQSLPNGHALVSLGNGGRVEEFNEAGEVVWRMENPGYVFRAQRILSLYHPGVASPR